MEQVNNGSSVLLRLTAFTDDPSGGNPAGVWIGDELPGPAVMQGIAADVGFSETAFLAPRDDGRYDVRYYSPEAEVSFCGHATIAAGVALGSRDGAGTYRFMTAAGEVPVEVSDVDGRMVASLTSVEPENREPEAELLEAVLAALGWRAEQLDGSIPPRLAYAGAWHLVIAVFERSTIDALEYDFDSLKALMQKAGLTTVQLIWRQSDGVFQSRNPFPVGGVVEDPATGASAAALGGYLRDAGLVSTPARLVIHQGVAMGRPSRIEVGIPPAGGVTVSGSAVSLESGGGATAPPAAAERLARAFLGRVWSVPSDLAAIDELTTEDYAIDSAGTVIRGRSAFKAWVAEFQEKLRGARTEILDVFADASGERVVSRWICRGTSNGIFGLPADGRPVEFSGIAIWRVRAGRLAECWVERSAFEAVSGAARRSALEDG